MIEESSGVTEINSATATVPLNQALGMVRSYLWTFAVTTALLTSLLITLFVMYIMQPLGRFSEAARKIGMGEYGSIPSLLSRKDEWRTLADAFRTMQSEMANREQRIVKNRDRLKAVLSSMVEGVVSITPERDVLIANRAACLMLGVQEMELRGRNLLAVIRNPELAAAIDKTQTEKTYAQTEFQISSEFNRRTISARVSVLPNTDDEAGLPGMVVVLHDMTELRQLENIRRDFVANVSHELKTPLASIKAYAETLRLGAINDQNRNLEFVEQIESQAEFLNQQIQDLLQLARVESRREVWDIQSVNLNEQCENCFQRFQKLAQLNSIDIALDLSDENPKGRADLEGMTTILNNLITNAINYTPGGGTITISTRYQQNSAVVGVTDSGIGIAPEHQARIFERFYRVDKDRSRDKGGTGLGLSIVKHLTQSFGGSVELKSKLGEGTTFLIRLPKFIE